MNQRINLDQLDALISKDSAAATAQVKQMISKEELDQGANPWESGTTVLFAIQRPTGNHSIEVVSNGTVLAKLKKLDDGVFASVLKLKNGDAFLADYRVDGKTVKERMQVEVYDPNPYTLDPPGGMKGELRSMGEFKSKVFTGTTRQWYVYLPPNLDQSREYPLLVGQDAQWDRQWMANALENCAREGKIPQTVGVFIEPGQAEPGKYTNRSIEYDSLNGNYSKMLLEEILPQVESFVHLTKDPTKRAISGMSSGGICSFTTCWERPDSFGTLISFIGSFANIQSGASKREGGHNYPFLIRKSDKKPIRAFLQDGENDLDNEHGNWWICNQQMVAALRFKGYDFVWVPGKGFHSTKHARRVFDQALVWWLGKP